VPRQRLATIWASPTEQRRFADALARFTATVAGLPPDRPPAVDWSVAPISAVAVETTEEIAP
jgi:hypothetical protein